MSWSEIKKAVNSNLNVPLDERIKYSNGMIPRNTKLESKTVNITSTTIDIGYGQTGPTSKTIELANHQIVHFDTPILLYKMSVSYSVGQATNGSSTSNEANRVGSSIDISFNIGKDTLVHHTSFSELLTTDITNVFVSNPLNIGGSVNGPVDMNAPFETTDLSIASMAWNVYQKSAYGPGWYAPVQLFVNYTYIL